MGLSSTHKGYLLSTSQRTRPRGWLLVEMNYLAPKKAIRVMFVTFLTRPLSIHCQQPHSIWFYSIRPSLVVMMHPHWSSTLWNQVQTHQNWNSFFYCSNSCSFVCVHAHVCVCKHMYVCVYRCMWWECICPYMHMWRPEIEVQCLPLLFSTSFFEIMTLTEMGACSFDQTGWTSSPQPSALPSPSLKPQHLCQALRADTRPLWSYPLCQLLRTSHFFLNSGVCIVPGMFWNPHLSPFLFLQWIEYLWIISCVLAIHHVKAKG